MGDRSGKSGEIRKELTHILDSLAKETNVREACRGLNIPRATYYRGLKKAEKRDVKNKCKHPLALSSKERNEVLDALHSEKYVDKAPHTVYAELLDTGTYLCSIRTMYRILADNDEVKERRKQVTRSRYKKPELLATTPNQVWSWDITKLKGPVKWTYFYLYVIMDIYSRYVTGWMVAERENAELAKHFIESTCEKQKINQEQLILHADRGSSMKSKTVAFLLADLGVTKSHSRPYVSNDNPYSEAQFKTLKYRPDFPERFGSIQDSRGFCKDFFHWYNAEHRHTGIALLTPEQVHYGLADSVLEQRRQVLFDAFMRNPNRFNKKVPVPKPLPDAAWINPPLKENEKKIIKVA